MRKKRGISKKDWDKTAGIICSGCNQETMRLIEGICPQCYNEKMADREERLGRKREKRYLVRAFNEGRITLRQMREGRLS